MPILGCLDFLKGTATLGFQILPAGGITGAPQMRWCSPNGTVSLEMVRIRDSAEVRRGVPPSYSAEAFFKRAPMARAGIEPATSRSLVLVTGALPLSYRALCTINTTTT